MPANKHDCPSIASNTRQKRTHFVADFGPIVAPKPSEGGWTLDRLSRRPAAPKSYGGGSEAKADGLLLPPGKTHQNPPEIFSGLATPPPSPVTRHPSPVTRRPKSISHKKPETDSTFVLSNHVTFSPLNSFNSVNPFNRLTNCPHFPSTFCGEIPTLNLLCRKDRHLKGSRKSTAIRLPLRREAGDEGWGEVELGEQGAKHAFYTAFNIGN